MWLSHLWSSIRLAQDSALAAGKDLLTYLGLEIDARQIQRMIERMGSRMARWRSAKAPVHQPTAGEVFCVSADGTGAPMRRKALRGRKGKRPGLREEALGLVTEKRQFNTHLQFAVQAEKEGLVAKAADQYRAAWRLFPAHEEHALQAYELYIRCGGSEAIG